MIKIEILKYNIKCTIVRKYCDPFITIKNLKKPKIILWKILHRISPLNGEIKNRVKMTLLVLSFLMIEPFFTIAITGQIMEPANNVMPESWNHASLPLQACAGPLAAAYVYERARVRMCGNVQGERSSGIS